MASLRYRRNRKAWEVDYRKRGVRCRRSFTSKHTAAEFRRKMEELIERERVGLDGVEPILFKDFCEIFLNHHFIEKSVKYRRTANYQIQRQFLPCFGNTEITAITFEDIVSWKEKRETENISSKTVREDLALLHLIFKAAIKNRYASRNPVDDVEYPRSIPDKIRTAVPDEKLVQALRVMSGLNLKIILLLRNTGMRLGELFRLSQEDIDFENKIIRIRSVRGGTTKNYQSRETILTPTVAAILRSLPSQGPFFPIKQRTFEARFYELKKKYGFDWDVHSLRHAFVTKLRNANIPERVVAHYVGHAQKNITDRYTSYTKEFIDTSVNAVDFGAEFLDDPENVVSIWSPTKLPELEPIEIKGKIYASLVPGAGIETTRSNKINKLQPSLNKLKSHKVWRKV